MTGSGTIAVGNKVEDGERQKMSVSREKGIALYWEER